jgi:hypothetical protein
MNIQTEKNEKSGAIQGNPFLPIHFFIVFKAELMFKI